jgi:hypothetical protein
MERESGLIVDSNRRQTSRYFVFQPCATTPLQLDGKVSIVTMFKVINAVAAAMAVFGIVNIVRTESMSLNGL